MTQDDNANQTIHLREIRELAQRFSPEELEQCMNEQLSEGGNTCAPNGTTTEIMNVLAKAEYVEHLMQQKGFSLPEAIRELGQRMRAVQQGGEAGTG